MKTKINTDVINKEIAILMLQFPHLYTLKKYHSAYKKFKIIENELLKSGKHCCIVRVNPFAYNVIVDYKIKKIFKSRFSAKRYVFREYLKTKNERIRTA